jgi:hypothetical protein
MGRHVTTSWASLSVQRTVAHSIGLLFANDSITKLAPTLNAAGRVIAVFEKLASAAVECAPMLGTAEFNNRCNDLIGRPHVQHHARRRII